MFVVCDAVGSGFSVEEESGGRRNRCGPGPLSYLMYLAEGRLTKAWKMLMQSNHPPFVINPEFSDQTLANFNVNPASISGVGTFIFMCREKKTLQ
jgi:hypothetical protein